ncbi:P-protein (Includes: Chorismate mutase; Prephenate dehydratase) [Burkholderiales bacterium]|nr:P-protein (Includes: Chorismate mutase; Prephenate dehydratase) [Burkholderiales bacterium]
MNERLKQVRDAIDAIDLQLVELLNERARLVAEVGRIKQESGAPVFQPEREAEVVRRVVGASRGPLPASSMEAIYREIMSAGRAIQRPLTVAYLGPQGTFSEHAMLKKFGGSAHSQSCASIDEVFRAAESERADYAVVPIENSSEGAVSRSLDLLLATSLFIVAEVSVPVHLHLLARAASLDGVRRVLAHPQALGQCIAWLNQNAPTLERVSVASNAEAARLASLDPGVAAIAGDQAAVRYGLQTVAELIQDDVHNRTRFVVLGRDQSQRSGNDKTSLILSVANRAGAVYEMLAPLARHGVSMTRFESRPARNGAWEYHFFVDVEGHGSDANVAQALRELQQSCAFYRCLGSYPRDA